MGKRSPRHSVVTPSSSQITPVAMTQKYGIEVIVSDKATKALKKIKDGAKAAASALASVSNPRLGRRPAANASAPSLPQNGKKGGGGLGALGGLAGGVGGVAVAALTAAAAGLAYVAKESVRVTAEFEKMEAVLTTTLQSPVKAKAAMALIQDFAAKTPFQVNQLTESYVKLANRGFVPTMAQMRSLGDLASSTGKDFDQLVEAMLDASTGEFERLKEFGVKASVNTKKGTVSFNFRGQVSEIQNTETAINAYILSLGRQQGITGSMAAISETTGGQISNLSDSMDMLFV